MACSSSIAKIPASIRGSDPYHSSSQFISAIICVCGTNHSVYIVQNARTCACYTDHAGEFLTTDIHVCYLPRKEKRKPLPKLVYNIMSDKQLRKKLKEYKLATQGTRKVPELMILSCYWKDKP